MDARRRPTVEADSAMRARLDEALAAALLERAENEPLAYVNAVQGFAALVAVDAELRVVHASANCASFFESGRRRRHVHAEPQGPAAGLDAQQSLVGRALDAFLDPEAFLELQEAAEECRRVRCAGLLHSDAQAPAAAAAGNANLEGEHMIKPSDKVEIKVSRSQIKIESSGRLLNCILHDLREEDLICIEFEPCTCVRQHRATRRASLSHVQDAIECLRTCQDVQSICEEATKRLINMVAFDRCLFYRMDRSGEGTVIAEAIVDNAPPETTSRRFIGLRYPAWDIPPAARRFFLQNRQRLIQDAAARA
eukprot:tig00021070_g17878.t1